MRDLISELLDFRKQEQGYLKLKIEHKDIVPFIKEIYMSFYEYAATQQINYRFECPEQELKLWFDPVQLQKSHIQSDFKTPLNIPQKEVKSM